MRAQKMAAQKKKQQQKQKSSGFFCCTSDNTVKKDLNMTEASRVEPIPIEEIPIQHHSLDMPRKNKKKKENTEAIIEARVSERLNHELNIINYEKEQKYQWQME